MVKGQNHSIYHFKIYKYDNNNNIINIKYFISAKQICETYNCSRYSIYNKINNPNTKSRTFINMTIEKIKEPMHILIENPRITELSTNNPETNIPENISKN
jgi:hypothetical protein